MYRAVKDKDENIFKGVKIKSDTIGYEKITEYFVDNSGFGSASEPALMPGSFLSEVKAGLYYCIESVGQFQVYIGEYKKISRKAEFERLGITTSKKYGKNLRYTEYKKGTKKYQLYNTDIITIAGNKIILNSGGYKTHSTKKYINRYIRGAYVYQKNYKWYLQQGNNVRDFFDGIEFFTDSI